MRNDTRAYFVAAVTHPDGYNGHEATAYVCFDPESGRMIAVYPFGWCDCMPYIAEQAARVLQSI